MSPEMLYYIEWWRGLLTIPADAVVIWMLGMGTLRMRRNLEMLHGGMQPDVDAAEPQAQGWPFYNVLREGPNVSHRIGIVKMLKNALALIGMFMCGYTGVALIGWAIWWVLMTAWKAVR